MIQRHKLRVLLYPPFYATLAWISYLRYDYSTTILFFATLFEAFAVYNLYACLQAYLHPFREEAQGIKEPFSTKVFSMIKVDLKSKWGMHYRIITDILVFQYPIWSIIDAFISIFTELKGYYCESQFNVHGAYLWLTIVNFLSLSTILSALFTYLAVFHREWNKGQIHAHGMFWCVKGPIMVMFYAGNILLAILKSVGVIKGTDGSHSSDGLAWPAEEVQAGIYVIIVCTVMCAASFAMIKFYNIDDVSTSLMHSDTKHDTGTTTPSKLTPWWAFVDAYLYYLPEFIRNVFCCGVDSFRLARKRIELVARRKQAGGPDRNTTQYSPSPNTSRSQSEDVYYPLQSAPQPQATSDRYELEELSLR
ncbi:hypothetical protein K7432_001997 [Basidiobolus ranarum]